MKHRIKKNKFNFGKDANKMLLRKLIFNFFENGYLETTFYKAKLLKSHVEKIISKGKVFNQSNKNYLLKNLGNIKLINKIFKTISPSFINISGGYVKIIRTKLRDGDGSLIARIEWAHPLITIDKEKNNKDNNLIDKNEKNTNPTNKAS